MDHYGYDVPELSSFVERHFHDFSLFTVWFNCRKELRLDLDFNLKPSSIAYDLFQKNLKRRTDEWFKTNASYRQCFWYGLGRDITVDSLFDEFKKNKSSGVVSAGLGCTDLSFSVPTTNAGPSTSDLNNVSVLNKELANLAVGGVTDNDSGRITPSLSDIFVGFNSHTDNLEETLMPVPSLPPPPAVPSVSGEKSLKVSIKHKHKRKHGSESESESRKGGKKKSSSHKSKSKDKDKDKDKDSPRKDKGGKCPKTFNVEEIKRARIQRDSSDSE